MANFEKRNGKYRGRVKHAPGHWKWHTLYTDLRASQKKLGELQAAADKRAAGLTSPETEKLDRGIPELAREYMERLPQWCSSADHAKISKFMLTRLIELGGWKFFRDITPESLARILTALENEGQSVSYRNKFIVRAKAFVHWLLPAGWVDPLRAFKRLPEKGAKRTRARRAATDVEIKKLFSLKMPEHRRLAYALAAFNGFRRSNVVELCADHLHLNAPIPWVELRKKQGHDDVPDCIPLHPFVLELIVGVGLSSGSKVVSSVPDMKTMAMDLLRAGIAREVQAKSPSCVSICREKGNRRYVEIGDTRGRRLDFHALRHTFQTMLDFTGCSRATKKKLMRHANQDVTDNYAHAELAEMRAALVKLIAPGQVVPVVATGTDGNLGTLMGQMGHTMGQFPALAGTTGLCVVGAKLSGDSSANGENGTVWHNNAPPDLNALACADMVEISRPSTQVD